LHISKLAWLWPSSASPGSLDCCLPVCITGAKNAYCQTCSSTASKFICKLTQVFPPSAYWHALDYVL
jgi:hypothetical protein